MLNELVRQLPGAELKPNGEIYVNGRKVDYLTLNGTDFSRATTVRCSTTCLPSRCSK